MKPRTLWACQSVAAMMSSSVAPSGRLSMSRTMAFLLPSRAVGVASLAVARLVALAFFGATGAASGAGAGVSAWMAFQIRVTAVLRSVNFLTGFRSPKGTTPAKVFQTSGKRVRGQSAESLANSFSVAKRSWPSGTCSAAVKAVMLLSVAMANVVMVGLLFQNSILSTIRRTSSGLIGCASASTSSVVCFDAGNEQVKRFGPVAAGNADFARQAHRDRVVLGEALDLVPCHGG